MNLTASDRARFWAKVDTSGECWEWTAYRNRKGYGQFRVGGAVHPAHRVAYAIAHGDVPDGLQVDHRCLTPSCVRAAHLRAATNKQNAEHRYTYGASRYRGVTSNRGRWYVRVMHHGREYTAGKGFDSPEAAAEAARALRAALFTHNERDRLQ